MVQKDDEITISFRAVFGTGDENGLLDTCFVAYAVLAMSSNDVPAYQILYSPVLTFTLQQLL